MLRMQWVRSVAFFAGAMVMASAQRVTFSTLALPLQRELGLSLAQVGALQSAVLAGYILGQVRAGACPVMTLIRDTAASAAMLPHVPMHVASLLGGPGQEGLSQPAWLGA